MMGIRNKGMEMHRRKTPTPILNPRDLTTAIAKITKIIMTTNTTIHSTPAIMPKKSLKTKIRITAINLIDVEKLI